MAGRVDAFNPAELLLAAVGACMMKNIERVAPIIGFKFRGVHIEEQVRALTQGELVARKGLQVGQTARIALLRIVGDPTSPARGR
ncbi:MAG: OsmC family protein [Metallibacterium scheffleri]|jgi:uncharacterized OsmC-like protein|uniref:OsmC family protein n=1 Tax=Metallibacterium scheffleri TaxID=993689 RepID=UPI0026EF7FF9|nr:hypothetical protein [Metallibacterium scheffleri]MCK9365774.1 OsmC family protein [Metallibacterium scheffleri]